MQASVSLGKDVIQTISKFLGDGFLPFNSRRSLTPMQEDKITEMVKMSLLCRDLGYCQGELRKFIDEFVIMQAKGVENILTTLLSKSFNGDIYDQQLKHILGKVRFILKEESASEKDEMNIWFETVKKISGKFQEMALQCLAQLSNSAYDVDKTIYQKLMLATVIIEMKYLLKLCAIHNICVKTYECTTSLNSLLDHLKTMKDEKARLFIKYVYEALYKTQFYSSLTETTAHEFQVILSDMAYSSNVPTQEILSVVHKIVGARVKFVTDNTDEKLSLDSLLLHEILSDLDNIYSGKSNPFAEFLNQFFIWIVRDDDFHLSKHIQELLTEIGKDLSNTPRELFDKLSREVRLFLEMTVDPE
ncbi:unnamed protein product [Pieris macdunnoughi]|uniref:Uncharacterized protein n=1 Tax=Pieris macdunnoughi TaxID=345717 RepID=A0A821R769_9NEOP|nr:unnamed protein product [Pieris macdunnoughi]